MSALVSVERISTADRRSQKCVISLPLFEKTNLEHGKYVVFKVAECSFICRLSVMAEPMTCVFLDDFVVRTENFLSWENSFPVATVSFPECISPIEVTNLAHVKVKIFLFSDAAFDIPKTFCKDVVHKIIFRLVVGNNYFINCRDSELAKSFGIGGILISEISPSTTGFGKIVKTTVTELLDVTTVERMSQSDSWKQLQSGGMEEHENLLKFYLAQSYKSHGIIVTGPLGSGKTLLVKQFCSKLDGCVILIDKLLSSFLNIKECNQICSHFVTYLKLFPNRTCVLIIDQLDSIVPFNSRQNLIFVSALFNLLTDLKELGVYILATAVYKSNIHHLVSSFFTKDINLGIPSLQQRKEILQTLTNSFSNHIDCEKIAQMTPGFVGHDLSFLIKEALNSSRNQYSELETVSKVLTSEDVEKALENIAPSVLKTSLWSIRVKPVYWKDIGGLFHVKKRLQMCIEWPLKYPEVFKKVDLPCPHGVLLFGPPGCCKTTLARGLASECNANFFAANPAQIYSPYVGESEKNIVELFYQARLCSPSIIFLDELDSLVSQRKLEQKSQGVGEKVLSTLLNEMDGFGTRIQLQGSIGMKKILNDYETAEYSTELEKQNSAHDVIVVAATNRPDLIDDALLRPGRFDIILYVPPPDFEERVSILETITEGMPMDGVDLKEIAEKTNLFSGADLRNLCNEAALNVLRQNMSAPFIVKESFDEALKKVKPSITRAQIDMYENLSSKYGTFLRNT